MLRVLQVDIGIPNALTTSYNLARNVATEVSASVLASDTGGDSGPVAHATLLDYLAVLERPMIIEDQPAWSPHLRSRTTLRRSPKRHFVDPSLAVAKDMQFS